MAEVLELITRSIALFEIQLRVPVRILPPSPAQTKITQLELAIAKTPNARLYNQLAAALCGRARETSDPSFYDRAEGALSKSRELEPANFEAGKIHVWALLGKHEFGEAREEAERLQKRAPDDLFVYGYLVDANVELGDYKQAEEAAQWMLDLRPGNVPGLTRAAYLRELFGDLEGAIEFMNQAYERTPPQEREDLAWIATQLGHLYLSAGKVELAEQALRQALNQFPNYHYALGQLAKVRVIQNGRPPFPSQVFKSSGETTEVSFTLPVEANQVAVLAVTIEPAGGSPQPTGPMVIAGRFQE